MKRFEPGKPFAFCALGVALVLALTACSPSSPPPGSQAEPTFKSEPNSFGGFLFGAPLPEDSELVLLSETGRIRYFNRPYEEFIIGETVIREIIYGVVDGQLFGVLLTFRTIAAYEEIKEILFHEHGTGSRVAADPTSMEYVWDGKDVTLRLSYDETIREGQIAFTYKPLSGLVEQLVKEFSEQQEKEAEAASPPPEKPEATRTDEPG